MTKKNMPMKTYILLLIVSLCASLCATTAMAQSRMNRQMYISKYSQWAVDEMKRTGIPASITLAQGILESDCGNSDLAVDANNHFGIKCHSDWTGERFYKDDDAAQECFRVYDSAAESFKDHSDFISTKKRYASLFELKSTDYEGWANGLKACGYATEPTYAQRLIKIIEEENLAQYDDSTATVATTDEIETITATANETTAETAECETTQTSSRKTPTVRSTFSIEPFKYHDIQYNNGVRYIALESGDSFESIATEFHMMTWELIKYNDLDANADIKTLNYLYLSPKKNRAHPDCSTHTVRKGDTLWSIAHKYGIKLAKLLSRNNMTEADQPAVDTVISLR